jgi:hypothetical protein
MPLRQLIDLFYFLLASCASARTPARAARYSPTSAFEARVRAIEMPSPMLASTFQTLFFRYLCQHQINGLVSSFTFIVLRFMQVDGCLKQQQIELRDKLHVNLFSRPQG